MAIVSGHCPFWNRADARCGDSFSLDNLDNAFNYCFGRYRSCRVYAELLSERRAKRGETPGENYDGGHIIQVTTRRKTADANKPSNAEIAAVASGIRARAR
jgi:hypothetical protein